MAYNPFAADQAGLSLRPQASHLLTLMQVVVPKSQPSSGRGLPGFVYALAALALGGWYIWYGPEIDVPAWRARYGDRVKEGLQLAAMVCRVVCIICAEVNVWCRTFSGWFA